jgi:hypothetical protein
MNSKSKSSVKRNGNQPAFAAGLLAESHVGAREFTISFEK